MALTTGDEGLTVSSRPIDGWHGRIVGIVNELHDIMRRRPGNYGTGGFPERPVGCDFFARNQAQDRASVVL